MRVGPQRVLGESSRPIYFKLTQKGVIISIEYSRSHFDFSYSEWHTASQQGILCLVWWQQYTIVSI